VKILLLSTYELGHQPLGIAGPGAVLEQAGHHVEAVDLSVDTLPETATMDKDAVVFSVPMHTATELAIEVARRIGSGGWRPAFAFVGLYANVLEGHSLLRPGDLLATGEAAAALLEWLTSLDGGGSRSGPVQVSVDLGTPVLARSGPPGRHLLSPLDRYARYLDGGRSGPAASVEASRGCSHRCRHCPVAAVYGGRSRAVPIEDVLADVEQVVEMGAAHVTFADPDFLNRPAHALAVAREVHRRFPQLTFDATVKVEHVLRHRPMWPELAAAGLTFVVSAFESTDDRVLSLLDKGHKAGDEIEAVAVLRDAGIEVRPSWLPFTPWTTDESLAALLDLAARADLVWNTDPVQYTIRLLLPRGSLLLARPDDMLAAALDRLPEPSGGLASDGGGAGSRGWLHQEPRIEDLRISMAALVESPEHAGASEPEVFAGLWALARDAGLPLASEPPAPAARYASRLPGPDRPRLSESWFCCAEPTRGQLALVRK
jgi:radical SAM superfamily enzyme YgiQ (UPF0313 family)